MSVACASFNIVHEYKIIEFSHSFGKTIVDSRSGQKFRCLACLASFNSEHPTHVAQQPRTINISFPSLVQMRCRRHGSTRFRCPVDSRELPTWSLWEPTASSKVRHITTIGAVHIVTGDAIISTASHLSMSGYGEQSARCFIVCKGVFVQSVIEGTLSASEFAVSSTVQYTHIFGIATGSR